MSNDLPFYENLFGVFVGHLGFTYGGLFNNYHYILTKDYYNEGCYTEDYTVCGAGTTIFNFLYPHWIKKTYYIEGVVEGQFTVACQGGADELISYTVELWKIDDLGNLTQIGPTVSKTLNYVLNWDGVLLVGDEIVIPFEIEVTPEVEMHDKERIFFKLTLVSDDIYLILYHSNDSTWEDIKLNLPFRGL